MFIEVRNIFLRWFFYNFFNVLGFVNRVMYHPCAPAVSPLRPRQIYGIATLHFSHIHAIVHYNRVDCLVYGVGDGVAVYGGEARIKASAAHAHKDDYSHTQCQE